MVRAISIARVLKGLQSMSRVRDLADHIHFGPLGLSSHVDDDRLDEVALTLSKLPLEIPTWDEPSFYPENLSREELCLFYLIFNSINYCYFDENRNRFREGGYGDGKKQLSGSSLVCTRLTSAWPDIKDPQFLCNNL